MWRSMTFNVLEEHISKPKIFISHNKLIHIEYFYEEKIKLSKVKI